MLLDLGLSNVPAHVPVIVGRLSGALGESSAGSTEARQRQRFHWVHVQEEGEEGPGRVGGGLVCRTVARGDTVGWPGPWARERWRGRSAVSLSVSSSTWSNFALSVKWILEVRGVRTTALPYCFFAACWLLIFCCWGAVRVRRRVLARGSFAEIGRGYGVVCSAHTKRAAYCGAIMLDFFFCRCQ